MSARANVITVRLLRYDTTVRIFPTFWICLLMMPAYFLRTTLLSIRKSGHCRMSVSDTLSLGSRQPHCRAERRRELSLQRNYHAAQPARHSMSLTNLLPDCMWLMYISWLTFWRD